MVLVRKVLTYLGMVLGFMPGMLISLILTGRDISEDWFPLTTGWIIFLGLSGLLICTIFVTWFRRSEKVESFWLGGMYGLCAGFLTPPVGALWFLPAIFMVAAILEMMWTFKLISFIFILLCIWVWRKDRVEITA